MDAQQRLAKAIQEFLDTNPAIIKKESSMSWEDCYLSLEDVLRETLEDLTAAEGE